MTQGFIEEPARHTPVVAEADVVVVGGGIAGASAAVSAAKNGARTILIERQDVLGRTVLGGSSVLNSFTNDAKLHPEKRKMQLVRGFGQEIINRMAEAGGCPGFKPGMTLEDPDAPRQVVMLPEIWKRVSFAIMREAGVEVMTRTILSDVIAPSDSIEAVIVQGRAGRGAIRGSRFIDTSGDGDLAARAGVPVIEEHEQEKVRETTLLFGMNNVDMDRFTSWAEAEGYGKKPAATGVNEAGLPVISGGVNLQEVPAIADWARKRGVRMMWYIAVGGEMYYINCTRVHPPKERGVMHHQGAFEVEMKTASRSNICRAFSATISRASRTLTFIAPRPTWAFAGRAPSAANTT